MATIPTNTTLSAYELYPQLNSLKLRQVYELCANSTLLGQHGIGGATFKSTEALAKELLIAARIVPRAAYIRHGNDAMKEADIIVNNKRQIEVVIAMADSNSTIDSKLLPFISHEATLSVSKAINSKFVSPHKIYTNSLYKCLFILVAGDNKNAVELAEDIRNHIQNRKKISNNFFETVYIARYDLSLGGYDLLAISVSANENNRRIIYNGPNIQPLITKHAVKMNALKDDSFYFVRVNADTIPYIPPLVVRGKNVANTIQQLSIQI